MPVRARKSSASRLCRAGSCHSAALDFLLSVWHAPCMLSKNSLPSVIQVPGHKARRLLRRFRDEVIARHGLTDLPSDVQLHLAAAAQAGAGGDAGKCMRELDAAHRQATQAAKRPAARQVLPGSPTLATPQDVLKMIGGAR